MTWKKSLEACFGENDGQFAIHPLDKRRAVNLLDVLCSENVSMADIEKEVRSILSGSTEELIDEQIQRIREMYGPRLNRVP